MNRPSNARGDAAACELDRPSNARETPPRQVALPEGGKGSLFDALEDMDSDACLERAKAIHAAGKK